MKRRVSSEECAEGFFDLADGVKGDMVLLAVETLEVVLGDDDVGEAQLLGLGDTLLDAVDWAYLARESHFAAHAPASIYRGIDIGGEDGGDDAEIHCEVGDAQASGNVDEDIFLHEFEADALLKDGEEHVEAPLVKACGRALGRSVGSSGDEGLRLK